MAPKVEQADTAGDATANTTPQQSSIDIEKISFLDLNAAEEKTARFERPISGWAWALVCVGLFLGSLLYGLDTTIAADVQGPILESLGEIEKLAWVGIGFPMGSVAAILLIGWCYALFEIKYLMIGSVLLFEIGSAVCGAAPTMNVMIAGRVIAGSGGAGMYLGALTYNSVFTSMKERPIYNAAIGLCWGTGAILGPVIGGGFAESKATWRWAFYINLPLAALVAPVYIFLFPKYNGKPDVSGSTKLKQMDWVGVFLNAGTWTLFQVACAFSGSAWKWKSAGPISLWVIFGVFLFAYIFQQVYCIFTTAERRLFPVQILKSRTIVLLYTAHAAAAAAVFIAIYYIPLFFQFTRGDSAIKAAVRLLPFICIMIFFVMLAGGLLPGLGWYMPIYIIAGVFITIGGALMHTVDANTKTGAIYGYEVLVAIGAGLALQVAYSVAVVKVKPEEIFGTTGVMNVSQIGTAAIALSLANIIFQNVGFIKLRDTLAGRGFSAEELRGALAGAKSTILAGDDPNVQKLAIQAIVDTMSVIWILVIVAGAVSIVSGAFMKREKLALQ